MNRTDASVTISGSVVEVRGRRVAQANFWFSGACPEVPTRWEAPATMTTQEAVLSGPATVNIYPFACIPLRCAQGSIQTTVQVRTR